MTLSNGTLIETATGACCVDDAAMNDIICSFLGRAKEKETALVAVRVAVVLAVASVVAVVQWQ